MKDNDSTLATAGSRADGLRLTLIPIGIALNLSIGTLVHLLQLPLYADAIGTITITLLLGIRAGVIVGIASFLIGGLLVNPAMPFFVGTQACIAIYTGVVAAGGHWGSPIRRIIAGLGLGVVAAVVSAPVIVVAFGGFTGSGSGMITAFLLATGKSIIRSVILTGIACEPVDKTVQCLLAYWLIKSLPQSILQRFAGLGYLESNKLLPVRV